MSRAKPQCFLFHNKYGWVPVISVTHYVTWDDGQVTRDMEPLPAYEMSPKEDFDFSQGAYNFQEAQSE